MKNFITILKKEVKELLTLEALFSLVIVFIIFSLIGKIPRMTEKEIEKITIGILDLDNSHYSQNIINILDQHIETKIIKDLSSAIKNETFATIIVIPEGFSKNIEKVEKVKLQLYYTVKGLDITGIFEELKEIIEKATQNITTNFIKKIYPDKDPEIILSPIAYEDFLIINKEVKKGSPLLLQQISGFYFMIALAVMYCIMFAGFIVITSMGQEKETKTLETLLTIPISRTYIIAGKIIASAIVAGLTSVAYIIAYIIAFRMDGSMTDMPAIHVLLKELGLAINFLDYTLLGITLFLAIIVALASCILLGVFVQDTTSAQILGTPIFLLAFLPFIVFQYIDIENLPLLIRIIMYANPFSYPFIAAKNIIFRDYDIILWGIVYKIMLTLILIAAVVRIFNTDKVITGKISIKKLKVIK